MCELSMNSPHIKFRNIYSIIIYNIIRKTANIQKLANIKREKRKQKELKPKILKIKTFDIEKLYRLCIKIKYGIGILDIKKTINKCKEKL